MRQSRRVSASEMRSAGSISANTSACALAAWAMVAPNGVHHYACGRIAHTALARSQRDMRRVAPGERLFAL